MADRSLAFRLRAMADGIAEHWGDNETGIGAHHVGDILVIQPFDHVWTKWERTEFGIVKVTGIPDDKIDAAERRLNEGACVAKVVQSLPGGWALVSDVGVWVRRPRKYRVSKLLCLAKWPAMELQINNLFDPEFEVPQAAIPTLPWTGFREVLVNKVTDTATEGTELETEDVYTEA